jgi:hypothetical protein
MQNLGRITNHHLVISDSEQNDLVNALRPDLPAARA